MFSRTHLHKVGLAPDPDDTKEMERSRPLLSEIVYICVNASLIMQIGNWINPFFLLSGDENIVLVLIGIITLIFMHGSKTDSKIW